MSEIKIQSSQEKKKRERKAFLHDAGQLAKSWLERGGKPGTGEADISNEGTWTVAGLRERKRFA